jgi:hypothetical protein
MAWQRGPLPKGTWNWGGVVTIAMLSESGKSSGFHFADFCGDHVKVETFKDGRRGHERVEAHEVAFYNNALDLPPEFFRGESRDPA